ncbi:hypothetical protein BDR05DRAFT_147784 [Suillus weaverae]|nr:hypothetical protein BDR05DRAFT_147784 [Suillus weaverae]
MAFTIPLIFVLHGFNSNASCYRYLMHVQMSLIAVSLTFSSPLGGSTATVQSGFFHTPTSTYLKNVRDTDLSWMTINYSFSDLLLSFHQYRCASNSQFFPRRLVLKVDVSDHCVFYFLLSPRFFRARLSQVPGVKPANLCTCASWPIDKYREPYPCIMINIALSNLRLDSPTSGACESWVV